MFIVLELLSLGGGGRQKLPPDSRVKCSFFSVPPSHSSPGGLAEHGLIEHSCNSAIPLGKGVLSKFRAGGINRLSYVDGHWDFSRSGHSKRNSSWTGMEGLGLAVHTVPLWSLNHVFITTFKKS